VAERHVPRQSRSAGTSLAIAAVLAATFVGLLLPGAASAANRIYWTNQITGAIRTGNLDGSGTAHNLFTGENGPQGVAIDPAANKIYWANFGSGGAIRTANLDGSGTAHNLFAGENGPEGIAIDPSANRIYWANGLSGTIRTANLDGSGSARTLFSGENTPQGIAIDPAANKIYWANFNPGVIRIANLDGSGTAQNLFTGESNLGGLAINPAANKIYWANQSSGAIRTANLYGSGSPSNLFAGEAYPFGVAIDSVASRIYWTRSAVRIANLDGSGTPQNLFASEAGARFPAILRSPVPAGAPAISGGGQAGEPLECSRGRWAPDLLGAFLYRAPRRFAFEWSRDGAGIEGPTEASFTPTRGGTYRCRVTASNHAGSASQTSAPRQIPPSNMFRFGKVKKDKHKGTARLTVKVPDPGRLELAGKGLKRAHKRAAEPGKAKLRVKSKGRKKRKLNSTGKAKVKAKVTFTPTGGTGRTKSKRVRLVKRKALSG
jgi:Low-density lipoprotein receptor repeat class B